ncbi:hypothetical protein MARINOS108_60110 [Marinoscillum sp. 108]|nr:hypothetical protein MARINOS108_60110 [Marinoscillum sp. 108]
MGWQLASRAIANTMHRFFMIIGSVNLKLDDFEKYRKKIYCE